MARPPVFRAEEKVRIVLSILRSPANAECLLPGGCRLGPVGGCCGVIVQDCLAGVPVGLVLVG
jgi:hypothetical protein